MSCAALAVQGPAVSKASKLLCSARARTLSEGLRAALSEEFLPWCDGEVAAFTTNADERIRLYEALAHQAAADAADDSDRAFAAAAQRLAADRGVHPGPIFTLRNGHAHGRLAIWAQTKPSGLAKILATAAEPKSVAPRLTFCIEFCTLPSLLAANRRRHR